jgi:rare lipoprotein A
MYGIACAMLCGLGCASRASQTPNGATGIASWYGPGFHGRRTASGDRYDQYLLTAAHRTWPLGTEARVTNLANGRSVRVRINDRGPFIAGRDIDLSYAAARSLDMLGGGTTAVRIEPFGAFDPSRTNLEWAVQVAAYYERPRADALRAELASLPILAPSTSQEDHRVYVTRFDRQSETFYRVRMGSFAARRDAERMAVQVARLGYDAVVVEEIVSLD